jgi:hypothetical protein
MFEDHADVPRSPRPVPPTVPPTAPAAGAPGGEVPLERLEAEICTLAGHLAAATCRWLLLVAEFDRREGWRGWEQASCAAWLSWKCGTSLTTAHEHLRVARALAGLPQLRDRFAAGRLSYAKVRAVTRIAGPADEQAWIGVAESATAAQLDRLVAACRTVTRGEERRRAGREKLTWRYHEDGTVVLVARLAPEHGRRAVAALELLQHAAADQDSSAEDNRPPGDDGGADDEPAARPGCSPVEAFVRMVDLAHSHTDKPALHNRGCSWGRKPPVSSSDLAM